MPRKTAAQKAAEEAAAAEEARRQAEQQRLRWVGAVILALALFTGGYAIGQANADDRPSAFGPLIIQDGNTPPGLDIPAEGFQFTPGERPRILDRMDRDLVCTIVERDGRVLRLECRGPGVGAVPDDRVPRDDRPRDQQPADEPGFLGVGLFDSDQGVTVGELADDSPAARAGMELGDVIVRFGDEPVRSAGQMADLVAARGAGSEIPITVRRFDAEVTFLVILGERP